MTLSVFANIYIAIVRLYQHTLSFDHGFLKIFYPHGYCRFYPSCSEYSIQVVRKYNLTVGLQKTLWRLLRCNPWNKGGYDPA